MFTFQILLWILAHLYKRETVKTVLNGSEGHKEKLSNFSINYTLGEFFKTGPQQD
jgi:hypothetical protein